jgi:Na+/proline symporter
MILAATSFGPYDWCVLIGYLVSCVGLGLWVSRSVHTTGSYFLGDRKLPWWIMVGQAFGTGTHAENPVAQTGSTFHAGFATIWYQWKNMLITPFYWLMAPWYRRSGRTTVAEMVEDRYGPGMGLVYTIYALTFVVFCQGTMLKGAGKIIAVLSGGALSAEKVVLLMAATLVVYSFFGGLRAAAYTDFLQGFLILALSFMLIPTGLRAVGGMSGMRAALPAGFFQLYGPASGIDVFAIAMLAINGFLGMTAQPHVLAMCSTGATERDGRIGMTYGPLIKRFCTIGWAMTGLIVAALVIQRDDHLADPEQAFGYACLELLGTGWVGLMVACVLAANMSACSSLLVTTGALFTRNIYRPYIAPAAGDRQLLWVGRISGTVLTGLGVIFALGVAQVMQAFLFTESISAFMGIMLFGGIICKRANRWGAAAATLASFATYYGLGYRAAGHGQLVYPWNAAIFGWAVLAGVVGLVIASLLTKPEDDERLTMFFEKQQATEPGGNLLLLDAAGWFTRHRWQHFFSRYREDLIGFVLAWGVVGLLVLLAWGLMKM